MSLSGELKPGTGAHNSNEAPTDPSWDPYPDGGEPSKSAPVPKSSAPGRHSINEPRLSTKLFDSLPTPKLTTSLDRKPANGNTSSNTVRSLGNNKPRSQETRNHLATDVDSVNPQQYVRELNRYYAEQNRQLTRDAVMDMTSREVERVADRAAKVRGRYIAKLLEAGNTDQAGLREAELLELRRYREAHEELCHGLNLLKSAIAEGDISVLGMTRC